MLRTVRPPIICNATCFPHYISEYGSQIVSTKVCSYISYHLIAVFGSLSFHTVNGCQIFRDCRNKFFFRAFVCGGHTFTWEVNFHVRRKVNTKMFNVGKNYSLASKFTVLFSQGACQCPKCINTRLLCT
jgi:hypothetical protein